MNELVLDHLQGFVVILDGDVPAMDIVMKLFQAKAD